MVEGELWNASIDEGSAEPEEELIVRNKRLESVVTRPKGPVKENIEWIPYLQE